jgi:hypothetical protein
MSPPGLKQLSIEVAELRLAINVETALNGVGSTFMSSVLGSLLDMNVEL